MSDSILVTRSLPDGALALLDRAGDLTVCRQDRPLAPGELARAAAGSVVLVTMLHDRIDASILDAAGPQLRCVANVAVGYDNIDVAAAHRRGIAVTNTPGVLTAATADLAITLMLAVTRRIGEGERLIRARTPWSWHMSFMLGASLEGKRLGIVGLGEIGIATARRARAFGMKIAYSGRRPAASELTEELRLERLELDALLTTSDVVSLHCPLTPETHHLLDATGLRRMKPTAYLVNTARGAIIDEAALAEALDAGHLAGAALDVYEHEPAVHPGLLGRDDVVLLPHLGSATVETRAAMAELAAHNVVDILSGLPPRTPVKTPVQARA